MVLNQSINQKKSRLSARTQSGRLTKCNWK